MEADITPFEVDVSAEQVEDLRARLAHTRWPEPETVGDWSQGLPLGYAKELCEYWAAEYDMGRIARRLNAFPQFRTRIDGLDVHFLHVRSPHPQAVPLVITHGWPGSVVEFLEAIGPLVDPPAHGGDAADAFHLVCPSLPGYGFSGKPTEAGWGVGRTADAWKELMRRLGYERYLAQGGDWGAAVTAALVARAGGAVAGIHLNFAIVDQRVVGEPTAEEQEDLRLLREFRKTGNAYAMQQSTRPQTLGYGLVDSPVAQCAWIVEKFRAWSDCGGHPEDSFSRDDLLDNVMVYWLTASGASAARMYWESFRSEFAAARVSQVDVPTAYSRFPREIVLLSERMVRTRYPDLRYYNRVARGGHFAAFEEPGLFVEELRAGFRALGVRE